MKSGQGALLAYEYSRSMAPAQSSVGVECEPFNSSAWVQILAGTFRFYFSISIYMHTPSVVISLSTVHQECYQLLVVLP